MAETRRNGSQASRRTGESRTENKTRSDKLAGGAPGGSYMLRGQEIQAPALAAGLYVVATPIGNLSDITVRALDTLAAADLIACEDTRVTRKLMTRYGIKANLRAYHDHSPERDREAIVQAVAGGKAVALVSDAGTPLISDPGYRLVDGLRAAGLPVVPVPGPSSLTAALSGAGLPTDRVHFAGFLAAKAGARRKQLGELATLDATLVLMESPNRLASLLADAAAVLGGETAACVCREMTKLHETFDRGSLAELAERYDRQKEGQEEQTVRGEVVLLIHCTGAARREPAPEEIDVLLAKALAGGSVRQAADRVSAETGLSRRTLYQRALALKDRPEGGR